MMSVKRILPVFLSDAQLSTERIGYSEMMPKVFSSELRRIMTMNSGQT